MKKLRILAVALVGELSPRDVILTEHRRQSCSREFIHEFYPSTVTAGVACVRFFILSNNCQTD